MPMIEEPLPDFLGIVQGPPDPGFRAFTGAAWEAHKIQTFGRASQRMVARNMHDLFSGQVIGAGRTLSPEEAQEEFGAPGLKFDAPINETAARMMMENRISELRHAEVIQKGSRGFGRKSWNFALGVMANMTDFPTVATGFLFPAARGLKLATTFGQGAKLGAIQALKQEVGMEAVILFNAWQEQSDYGVLDAAANVTFSAGLGALGGGIGGRVKGMKQAMDAAKLAYLDKIPVERKQRMMAGLASDLVNDRPISTPGRMVDIDPRVYDPEFHASAKRRVAVAELRFLEARAGVSAFNRIPEPPLPNKKKFFKSVKGQVPGEEAVAKMNAMDRAHREWAKQKKKVERAATAADKELAQARDLMDQLKEVAPDLAEPRPVAKMTVPELKAEVDARSGGAIDKKRTKLSREQLEKKVQEQRVVEEPPKPGKVEQPGVHKSVEDLSRAEVLSELNRRLGLELKENDPLFDEEVARTVLNKLASGETVETMTAPPKGVFPDSKYDGKRPPAALSDAAAEDTVARVSPEQKKKDVIDLHRGGREATPPLERKAARTHFDDQYDVRAVEAEEELRFFEDSVKATAGDQADEFIDAAYKADGVELYLSDIDGYRKALHILIPCMRKHT